MPSRFACVHLPDLALEAHLRAQPKLRAREVVVVENPGPAARVLAANERALKQRIRPGLGVSAARRLVPDVEVRVRDPELERHALEELEAVAASFSPTLEIAGEGTLHLDASGVAGLFGGELGFGEMILLTLGRKQLQATVGIASSRAAAYGAARWRRFLVSDEEPPEETYRSREATTVIEPGREEDFLAPLLLGVFDPHPEHAALLYDLGVRTCGALRALATASVADRLGPEGLELRARAGGEDPRVYLPMPRPEAYREALELEEPLTTLPAILAALEHLLRRAMPPLVEEGLAVGGLRISLALDPAGVDLRVLNTASPAREIGPLLKLVEEKLRSEPPRAPVAAVEVELRATRIRPVQLSLFLPAGPSPRKVHGTVSRVEGLVGTPRIGAPGLGDDHRPAAYAQGGFRPPAPRHDAPPGGPCASQLRAFRPPVRIAVRTRREQPVTLHELPTTCRLPETLKVRRRAGPWYLSGGWWSPRPFHRAYWDLEVEGERLVRVFQDLQGGRWWLDGVHD